MKGFVKATAATLLSAAMVFSMASCKGNSKTSESSSTSSGTLKACTISISDWSNQTKDQKAAAIKDFEAANPGVTINYTVLTQDQFRNTILTAVSANNAPDIFPVPVGTYLATAVKEGWYTPVDKYFSKSFLSTFSDGSFNDGLTSINKKMYALPSDNAANSIAPDLCFYNKKIISENNIDVSKLTTWTAFENACKTVTTNGKGQYYGMITGMAQTANLEAIIRQLAAVAGAKCNNATVISFTDDGKSWFNSQPMLDAMGFFQKLANDKVFDPDSASIADLQARSLFGAGKAAFIFDGAYCIGVWKQSSPDLDFGVINMPYPDSGKKGDLQTISPSTGFGINAQSKSPEACAAFLQYWFSADVQTTVVSKVAGYLSNIKGINEKAVSDATMKEYMSLSDKYAKRAPNPIIGNPNCAYVYAEAKNISPDIGQITQGVLTGGIKDYKSSLNKLADATSTEWKRAIDAVNSKGNKVSIADFEFSNWNLTKDYASSDYTSKSKSSSK